MAEIGIRREDKSRWERRAPLTPAHVRELVARGMTVAVEPSEQRVFSDQEYAEAGAELSTDLSSAKMIFGVKEIPLDRLYPGRPHFFFAHVIKGQAYNMPLLSRLLEIEATLIDYERITDAENQRLIAFGRHAGYAGMVDALWTLGRRLSWEGLANPFESLHQALRYRGLEEVRAAIRDEVGEAIRRHGILEELHPLVVGFAGSGRVSRGSQAIFDLLPHAEISPEELAGLAGRRDLPRDVVYKVCFSRKDREDFSPYLPHLTLLVNAIYWEKGHPRLVRLEDLDRLWAAEKQPRMRVLADLSCDKGGGIEANLKQTNPDHPAYVYDVAQRAAIDGVAGRGPVVLAVEILPAELPRDSSEHFGERLLPLMPQLTQADFEVPFDQLRLPPEVCRAVITHRGELTPNYRYLRTSLDRH